MKKNVRVFQINGFRGLFLVLFVIACVFAGFIVFPAFLSMHLWNFLSLKTGSMPTINLLGGMLLWGIIALSCFLINKRKYIVCFSAQQELSEDELKTVMSKIRKHSIESGIIVPKDIKRQPEEKPENSDSTIENK